jgi:hypothetical protein
VEADMVHRLRSTARVAGFVSIAGASLFIGAATTSRAGLLLAALLLGTICVLALRGPWVAAVGLLPVFLLPYTAMSNQYPHGLHVVPLLMLFVLGYGAAAWSVAPRHRVRASAPALVAVGVFALSGGVAEWIARGVPKDTAYTTGLWLGGLLLGCASSTFGEQAVTRLALCMTPLALVALFEAFERRNVWSSAVGPLLYEDSFPFRATSTFGHPLVAGTAFVIVALMVLSARHPLSPILAALLILGAGATLSRSPVLGVAVGVVVLLLQRRRTRLRVFASIVVVAIGLVIALDVAPGIAGSARARLFGAEKSKTVRLQSLHGFGDMVRTRPENLLLPQDRNRTSTNAVQGSLVDDQYVALVYDYGLLAVLAAAAALVAAGRGRLRSSGGTLAAIVGALTMFAFFEGLYWPSTATLFWFAVGFTTTRRVDSGAESG